MAGKLKTRAKRVEIGNHLQPLLRRLRNQPVGGRGQISISAGLGPPHTPAKLVKLRQPKAVRPMNDKRIGAWYIKPALHDGRGKQHIIALVVKGRHALFDLGWRHLSMCDAIADLRDRKSVEKGKGGYVRVDIGGRR